MQNALMKFLKIDDLMDSVSNYMETRVELFKLDVQEKISKVVAKVIIFFSLLLFFFITLLFASLSLALYINHTSGNPYSGFVIVTLFYLLLLVGVFIAWRKFHLDKKLENMTEQMFDNQKENGKHS